MMAHSFNKSCAGVWAEKRFYDRSLGKPGIFECRVRYAGFLVKQQRRHNGFRGAASQREAFAQRHSRKTDDELFGGEMLQISPDRRTQSKMHEIGRVEVTQQPEGQVSRRAR